MEHNITHPALDTLFTARNRVNKDNVFIRVSVCLFKNCPNVAGLLQVYPFWNPLPQDTIPNHPSVPVQFIKTRMHSSRMHTVRSSWGRRGWGWLPQCMLSYTPGCVPRDSPGCVPGDPPGCVPGNSPWPDPTTSILGVGMETPRPDPQLPAPPQLDPSTSPLGVGLETCKACWDTSSPFLWTDFLTHAFKNITLPKLRF